MLNILHRGGLAAGGSQAAGPRSSVQEHIGEIRGDWPVYSSVMSSATTALWLERDISCSGLESQLPNTHPTLDQPSKCAALRETTPERLETLLQTDDIHEDTHR